MRKIIKPIIVSTISKGEVIDKIQLKKRAQTSKQARLIAMSNDGIDISGYAKELKDKWVKGEITMEERKFLLLNRYKKKAW
jgi:hypothetical protein